MGVTCSLRNFVCNLTSFSLSNLTEDHLGENFIKEYESLGVEGITNGIASSICSNEPKFVVSHNSSCWICFIFYNIMQQDFGATQFFWSCISYV